MRRPRRARPRLASALVAFAVAACGPGERGGESAAPPPPAEGAAAGESPPPADERASFVGSARCAGCHAAEAAAWRGSHHELAMQPATPATVLGDFSAAPLVHDGVEVAFERRGDRFFVRTPGEDGQPAEHEVAYTFGVDPLQQYLVAFPNGRYQVLPAAWDTGKRRWYHFVGDPSAKPGDAFHWTGRYQSWNAMCAECHSTDLRRGYDAATDRYASTWAELGVGCEACHGPGAAHVAAAEAGRGREGLAVRYSADEPRVELDSCAPCHSRRRRAGAEDLHGRAFLEDWVPSTLREGLYHADGQILDEVYEYGSFTQSRMHAAGVRCSDCHDPHSLRLRAEGDALCTRCHSPQPDARFPTLAAKRYDAPEHHHHAADSAGARCTACHMPTRVYMGVDARHDHSLRIPRPDLSEKLGTPNACNACHADRTPAWAAAAIARWYGPERRQEPHWGETLAAGRAGQPDAGPALVALARDATKPALARASAVELLPAYGLAEHDALAEALRDPEPLVRIAAAASLDALPLDERVDPARAALADPLRAVRVESARALGPLASEFLQPDSRRRLFAALEEYEAIQRAEGDFATAHHNLAVVAEAGGDVKLAEAEYRQALRLDPGFQPARVNLATLLSRTGKAEESEALLREAIARAPEDGELHYSLGLLLAERGRFDDAERALREATARLPGRPRVRYNHALALQHLGRSAEAEQELLALLAAEPRSPDLLHALVALYAQTGQWQRALPHARALVELVPDAGARAVLLRVEEEATREDAGHAPGSG